MGNGSISPRLMYSHMYDVSEKELYEILFFLEDKDKICFKTLSEIIL